MAEPRLRPAAPYDDLRHLKPETAWKAARRILNPTWKQAMRLRVYGRERLPRSGPIVLASNHQSLADIFALGLALSPRSIRYMAKRELFEMPVVGYLMPHTGAFAVRRGESDRDAIVQAKQVIDSGNVLGIFVEGTRHKEIGDVLPGAAMVAISSGAPIVACCINGGAEHMHNPFNPITISFSTPMDFSSLPRGAKTYRWASRVLKWNLERQLEFLRAVEAAGRPTRATPPEGILEAGD